MDDYDHGGPTGVLGGPTPATIDDRALQRLWSEMPSGLSDETWSMVRGLLKLNPRNRLTAQQLLHHPFFRPDLPVVSLPYIASIAHTLPAVHKPPATTTAAAYYSSIPSLAAETPPSCLDAVYRALNRRPASTYNGQVATPTLTHAAYPDGQPMYPAATPPGRSGGGPSASAPVTTHRHTGREPLTITSTRLNPSHRTTTTTTMTASSTQGLVNTKRLHPIHKPTKHVTFEIRSDGRVMAHFNGDREVLLVNARGTKLYLFARRDVPVMTEDVDLRTLTPTAQYSTADLPAKYTKSFDHIIRFVQLVRSKTARIILTTPQARCSYMENEPMGNLLMKFYNGIVVQISCLQRTVEFRVPQKNLPDSIHQFTLPATGNGSDASSAAAGRPHQAAWLAESELDEGMWPKGARGAATATAAVTSGGGGGNGGGPAGSASLYSDDPIRLGQIRDEIPEFLRPLYQHLFECYQQCLAIHVDMVALETRRTPSAASGQTAAVLPKYPIAVKITDMDQRPDIGRILRKHFGAHGSSGSGGRGNEAPGPMGSSGEDGDDRTSGQGRSRSRKPGRAEVEAHTLRIKGLSTRRAAVLPTRLLY
ncbi:hypothetical protein BJ085DRAFT_36032 [Dimargaris cristalligena]|uniref:Uncharacterized protein n=1 Tax=Dimargaris cristalligena TaxID=215637 RepID=A0A4P9ZP62_9FUNG|nr:hypothetical protein BJ085DRAFT_36032 [Dimargaris cristalligena]|eukprot:RKP35113.1 hypothetical protein BJ085DRAFT_36032 [Dimargaris cristalligena]